MQRILLLILLGIFLLNGCKEEEEATVEPSEYGTIEGVIIEEGTNTLLANVNVFSVPASSFVTTDESGAYTISNVTPGEYEMYAYKNTYDTSNVSVTVTADAKTIADFTMREYDEDNYNTTGTITGTVRNKKDNSAIETVSIRTLPVTSVISTDVNGLFTLENVDPGTYQVFAEKDNFDTTYTNVTVITGQTTTADFYLAEQDTTTPSTTGSASGIIKDAIAGTLISGAIITTDPSTSSVLSSDSGEYKLENLSPEEYELNVVKSGYELATATITIEAGLNTNADIVLTPTTGQVNGVITDAVSGNPISGVIVTTDPGSSSVTSASDGTYLLSSLSSGSYTIITRKNGYISGELEVVVNPGDSTNADIAMEPETEDSN